MFILISKKRYYENLATALRTGFKLGHEAGFKLASGQGIILAGITFKKEPDVLSEAEQILKEKER